MRQVRKWRGRKFCYRKGWWCREIQLLTYWPAGKPARQAIENYRRGEYVRVSGLTG